MGPIPLGLVPEPFRNRSGTVDKQKRTGPTSIGNPEFRTQGSLSANEEDSTPHWIERRFPSHLYSRASPKEGKEQKRFAPKRPIGEPKRRPGRNDSQKKTSLFCWTHRLAFFKDPTGLLAGLLLGSPSTTIIYSKTRIQDFFTKKLPNHF